MILETVASLLGGLGGAAARLTPDILKFFDRKNERKHELAMQDKQFAFEQMRLQNQVKSDEIKADSAEGIAWLEAVRESHKAAAVQSNTGVKFVDALLAFISGTVRPMITYGVVTMWGAVKIATYDMLRDNGVEWSQAVVTLWGPQDFAILAAVIGFWFVDRSLRNR